MSVHNFPPVFSETPFAFSFISTHLCYFNDSVPDFLHSMTQMSSRNLKGRTDYRPGDKFLVVVTHCRPLVRWTIYVSNKRE